MLQNNRLLFAFVIFLALSVPSFAQDDIILIRKYAETAFKKGDYEYALQNYLELYKYDKNNLDLHYKIGVCYTETNVDKEKAIPFLEYVVSFNNYPIRTKYYLGKAYMYNYRFTEAIDAFYDYKMVGIDENDLLECDRMIDMCEYSQEIYYYPVNVRFTRLDTTVNTSFDEIVPVVSSDNQLLYFSSNRHYIDEYESYVYSGHYSENRKGQWQGAVQIPISTYDDENVMGITSEGDKMLVYANGDYSTHDIKMYTRKGAKFAKALASELPSDMNTDDVEMGACFSSDGNTIYYASDKPGGRGGLDLYVAHKGPDGKWGPSQNLGTTINTEYDENYPTLSPDGKKLYFASKGHNNVGGYDIFSASFDENSGAWFQPRNMGPPINTPQDNTKISFASDGTAYIAAKRKEGIGNMDIYRLDFENDSIQTVFFTGTVLVGDTEDDAVPYNESMPKAYATIYDTYGNVVELWDVQDDGYFYAPLYEGDYTIDVYFQGQTEKASKKIHIGTDGSPLEKFLIKPLK